jgi:hypothetical protein
MPALLQQPAASGARVLGKCSPIALALCRPDSYSSPMQKPIPRVGVWPFHGCAVWPTKEYCGASILHHSPSEAAASALPGSSSLCALLVPGRVAVAAPPPFTCRRTQSPPLWCQSAPPAHTYGLFSGKHRHPGYKGVGGVLALPSWPP